MTKYGRLKYNLHKSIGRMRSRLKLFQYDEDTRAKIEQDIADAQELIRLLDKETPIVKLHEYGGAWKCPKCEVVVNQYAKYCHYCGQRFLLKEEGLQGWNPEK